MRIWYKSTLDMDRHPGYAAALTAHFARVASVGTEVVLRGRDPAAGGDLSVAEVAGSPIMFQQIVVPDFVRTLVAAERDGADAFVVGSFSEPVLGELRSLARIPVVSMSEACFSFAAMCAPRVGLVTLNSNVVPFLERSARRHGWSARLSGIHCLAEPVAEEDLDAGILSPGRYLDLIVDAVRRAIADGAQAIVLAEGVLAVMAATAGLREVDGVPVVDSVGTPILVAELAVAVKERTGVAQSRAAYPPPTAAARLFLESSVNPT